MITIYRYKTTNVRAVVNPDDRSQQTCGLMREDIVTISFTSPVYIGFEPGDYTTVFNKLYKLNKPAVYLLQKATEYLNKAAIDNLQYPVKCNDSYFKMNGIRLVIGSVYNIHLPESGLSVNKRVISYQRNIRNPDKYEFELADTVPVQPLIIKLINKL